MKTQRQTPDPIPTTTRCSISGCTRKATPPVKFCPWHNMMVRGQEQERVDRDPATYPDHK